MTAPAPALAPTADTALTRVSRRGVLAGAAWTAPVVVVAAAVPAHAASGDPSTLVIVPDQTAATSADVEGVPYVDVVFTGLSITVPEPVAAASLTLTATFVPDVAGGPADLEVYGTPDGWVTTPVSGRSATVTMVLVDAVAAGTEVRLPDGDYFGTAEPAADQTGSFVLTASAPGLTSATLALPTGPPPVRGAGRGRGGYRRPA